MFSLPNYTDAQVIDYWSEICRHAKRRGFVIVIDEFEGFTVREKEPTDGICKTIGKCTTLAELEIIIREDEIPELREPLDA